jgi:hypothetical protein
MYILEKQFYIHSLNYVLRFDLGFDLTIVGLAIDDLCIDAVMSCKVITGHVSTRKDAISPHTPLTRLHYTSLDTIASPRMPSFLKVCMTSTHTPLDQIDSYAGAIPQRRLTKISTRQAMTGCVVQCARRRVRE